VFVNGGLWTAETREGEERAKILTRTMTVRRLEERFEQERGTSEDQRFRGIETRRFVRRDGIMAISAGRMRGGFECG